eukprot:SM000025S08478  [mRNA]  locus=s25:1020349:1022294:- [translate_table: standard]
MAQANISLGEEHEEGAQCRSWDHLSRAGNLLKLWMPASSPPPISMRGTVHIAAGWLFTSVTSRGARKLT